MPTKKIAPVTKPAAKVAKKKTLPIIDTRLSRGALVNYLMEHTEFTRADVNAVLEGLEKAIIESVRPGSCGEFILPGLLKIKTRAVDAVKGGKKVPNPFKPGETMITKSKPATLKLKVLPMIKLKAAAGGNE